MIKSKLDEFLARELMHLPEKKIQDATKLIVNLMTESLSQGGRIEVRGFGSFALHHRPPRASFNPKTGKRAKTHSKYIPHFKPGKTLKQGIDENSQDHPIVEDD